MQQANIINMKTNKYEPQQKHRLGTFSKNYCGWVSGGAGGGGGRERMLKPLLRDPNLYDKYYDETKMRTRQNQRVATDTWRSLGCRTTFDSMFRSVSVGTGQCKVHYVITHIFRAFTFLDKAIKSRSGLFV